MATVLLIDDDPLMRRAMGVALEAEGHRVVAVPDGRAGLEVFDDDVPDLIVTDLVMDGGEGIEMIFAIRKRSRTVPVVALSGSDPLLLRLAEDAGANRAFQKPVTWRDFLDAVGELLGGCVGSTARGRVVSGGLGHQ